MIDFDFEPTLTEALKSLGENPSFSIENNDLKTLIWQSPNRPTDKQVEDKLKELKSDWAKNEYRAKRKKEYKLLDSLLFEAIAEKENGSNEKMDSYLIERQKIKDKYPKA